MQGKRIISIDILKFLAVLLIINSHADIMYPDHLKMLATGGAIGDVLFLFCSGYTLFRKDLGRFDNWYKRRINRIYPTVISIAIVADIVFGHKDTFVHSVLLGGGKPFLNAIMIYYVLLWFIGKYAKDKVKIMFGLVACISLIAYIFCFPYKYETSSLGLYGTTTYFRWIPYFGFMLLGAILGTKNVEIKKLKYKNVVLFAVSFLMFYAFQLLAKHYRPIAPIQIVTLIPLIGIVYYLYKICNSSMFSRLYQNKIAHAVIMTIAGLCLESYLIQEYCFTSAWNSIFPLNVLFIYVIILLVSYIVRCIARLFSQIFREKEFEWKAIIKIY